VELTRVCAPQGGLYRRLLAKDAAAFVKLARSSSSCGKKLSNSKFSGSSAVRCPGARKASVASVRAAVTHRDIVQGEMVATLRGVRDRPPLLDHESRCPVFELFGELFSFFHWASDYIGYGGGSEESDLTLYFGG
jgi:hypothetical protein